MENKSICKNAWCRAPYVFEGDIPPGQCPKCGSFNKDTSGGVSWNENWRTYSEPRYDSKDLGSACQIKTRGL
jgi:hypothetical protein